GNEKSQAASMTIEPGDSEGDPENNHRGADQWLFVVEGNGHATVNGKRFAIKQGSLLLIEKGDRHQIINTGEGLLRTLNIYVPPAYTPAGNENKRGKRKGEPK
ncbi:MAG: cupin domain-containing protein, partial [Proteobacteria bacterium]